MKRLIHTFRSVDLSSFVRPFHKLGTGGKPSSGFRQRKFQATTMNRNYKHKIKMKTSTNRHFFFLINTRFNNNLPFSVWQILIYLFSFLINYISEICWCQNQESQVSFWTFVDCYWSVAQICYFATKLPTSHNLRRNMTPAVNHRHVFRWKKSQSDNHIKMLKKNELEKYKETISFFSINTRFNDNL